MPDEADSWVETLGVTWFQTAEDGASAGSAVASDDGGGLDSAVESATDAAASSIAGFVASDSGGTSDVESDADSATGGGFSNDIEDSDFQAAGQFAPADIVADPDTSGDSTLIVDPPIGVLQLRSSSQVDPVERVFNVVVDSSAKDALLFGASVTGTSIGTVKISQPTGTTTLKDVQITSINSSGGTIAMTLESPPPKKKRPGAPSSPVLIIPPPIGTLPLLSFLQADKAGRTFDVTIPITTATPLLIASSASGKSLGTVQISTPDILVILRDAQISSINTNVSAVQVRLESASPAEISQ